MRIVLQRVNNATVKVDGQTIGSIEKGYVILLGIGVNDTKEQVDKMVNKIKKLRIFPDGDGKTNLSIENINGEILIISQFTLYADCKKGNRPSFTDASSPELAKELYRYFIKACDSKFKKVAHGEFGADMKVELTNDGPFTMILEN